jgi:hypothetical protein
MFASVPSKTSQGTNTLDVLERYMREAGARGGGNGPSLTKNAPLLRARMYAIIAKLVLGVVDWMREKLPDEHNSPQLANTFFELFRWDFIVDEQGNPYLMEINMSPNLVPKYFDTGNDSLMKLGVVKELMKLIDAGAPKPTAAQQQGLRGRGYEMDDGAGGAGSVHHLNQHCRLGCAHDQRQCWGDALAGGEKEVPWDCWGCANCDQGRVAALKLRQFDDERARTSEYRLVFPTVDAAAAKFERFMGGGKDAKEAALDVLLRRYVMSRQIK